MPAAYPDRARPWMTVSAPAAALVVFVTIVAIVVVVMAILHLVKRVQALKGTVQELSATLDPALTELRRGTEVTRNELAALQDAAAALEQQRSKG